MSQFLFGPRLDSELDRLDGLLQDPVDHRFEWPFYREPGGVLVPTAAVPAGDGAHVDVVLGTQADADVSIGPDLEKRHGLNLARGERQIDQAFRVVVRRAGGVEDVVVEI